MNNEDEGIPISIDAICAVACDACQYGCLNFHKLLLA